MCVRLCIIRVLCSSRLMRRASFVVAVVRDLVPRDSIFLSMMAQDVRFLPALSEVYLNRYGVVQRCWCLTGCPQQGYLPVQLWCL